MIQRNYKEHLIPLGVEIKTALKQLDKLAADAILFVVDDEQKLIGSLTDGDVRRGLLRDLTLTSKVEEFIQPNPKYVFKNHTDINEIIQLRTSNFRIIPVLNEQRVVINVINFRFFKSFLPIDVVIMAGGRGERLKPLTDTTPKPLLKIGDKPIIEHNIDRLSSYGIHNFWISVRYLGEQIQAYFKDGASKNITTHYIKEEQALGTIGAARQIDNFEHNYVLITNSDILSNIDYEDFFLNFLQSGADLSVATIPYDVNIPYAVMETENGHVVSLKEKPTYTYYSNGGIYLVKKDLLQHIPFNAHFNATDFMELLITKQYKVHSYPLRGYWLDIGKHEDFIKAQTDINTIRF
jgi:dTDP-glucose pyrophosphorylase/mRNA-degrading endonuclease RelE of RelBE toxin-antitoxin system